MGMLDTAGAWQAREDAVGEWYQMDLGSVHLLVGVVTQGRYYGGFTGWEPAYEWVTSYNLSYSENGVVWSAYGGGAILLGNTNSNSKRTNTLTAGGSLQAQALDGLMARYVRIHPLTWNNHISMRA
ncbi:hypothetical protein CYMTET_30749, partial [Cymbomonas tetramitiformis]